MRQEFLDDGENVFGSYPNVSFLHDSYVFLFVILCLFTCHSERSEESEGINGCNQILRVAQDDTTYITKKMPDVST